MSKETEAERISTYDVVVIGGGPTGENVAQYAIENTDLTAVLVEGELLGGECFYYTCMLSKAFLVPIEVATASANLGGLRPAELSVLDLLERRDEWVSRYDDTGQVRWAEGAGLDVVHGWARLDSERRVAVRTTEGERVLHARCTVVLVTGAQPVMPAAFQGPEAWDSCDATGIQEIPQHLIAVGGGVVACEAVTWMSALGGGVAILVRNPRLLSAAESFVSRLIKEALTARGVTVMTDARVIATERFQASDTGLGRVHGGPVTATCAGRTIKADEILVATGRHPPLTSIGLEIVGLESDNAPTGRLPGWLYAVGGAGGKVQLTHIGRYRARVVGERIAVLTTGCESEPVPESIPVPQVVFTGPQFASSGLTEQRARALGHSIVTAQVGYTSAVGVALLRDDAHGEAKLVADRQTGAVLGATLVGSDAGEFTHATTIAITAGVPAYRLRYAVPAYSTASETRLRLIESLPSELLHPER